MAGKSKLTKKQRFNQALILAELGLPLPEERLPKRVRDVLDPYNEEIRDMEDEDLEEVLDALDELADRLVEENFTNRFVSVLSDKELRDFIELLHYRVVGDHASQVVNRFSNAECREYVLHAVGHAVTLFPKKIEKKRNELDDDDDEGGVLSVLGDIAGDILGGFLGF